MKRRIKNFFKKCAYHVFTSLQHVGLNVLPYHYYSSIPGIPGLKKDTFWRLPFSLYGVNGKEIEKQASFLEGICDPEIVAELDRKEINKDALLDNGVDEGYGVIESDFLYCFIRKVQPKKIIQIGCGVSTSVVLRAAADSGYVPELVCIDPYPTKFLRDLESQNKIRLIVQRAQLISLDILTDLSGNDLFFVDSTHTVKTGSEVNRIILEVLPRLEPNIWIHFHDIYFPFDYSRSILDGDIFFWNESTLLHAYLVNNPTIQIMISLGMLHYERPEIIRQYFRRYIPRGNNYGMQTKSGIHFPSSIFLQTI